MSRHDALALGLAVVVHGGIVMMGASLARPATTRIASAAIELVRVNIARPAANPGDRQRAAPGSSPASAGASVTVNRMPRAARTLPTASAPSGASTAIPPQAPASPLGAATTIPPSTPLPEAHAPPAQHSGSTTYPGNSSTSDTSDNATGSMGGSGTGGTGNGNGSGNGHGSDGGNGSAGTEGARLRAMILARIRAHRRYPELARRRGVTGQVELFFRILPSGRVADLAVRRGADPMLDEAAKDAVRAAAPLPPLSEPLTVVLDFMLTPGDSAPSPAAAASSEEESF